MHSKQPKRVPILRTKNLQETNAKIRYLHGIKKNKEETRIRIRITPHLLRHLRTTELYYKFRLKEKRYEAYGLENNDRHLR